MKLLAGIVLLVVVSWAGADYFEENDIAVREVISSFHGIPGAFKETLEAYINSAPDVTKSFWNHLRAKYRESHKELQGLRPTGSSAMLDIAVETAKYVHALKLLKQHNTEIWKKARAFAAQQRKNGY